MTIISLRDYAKSQNVSYEAIRKQVVRYKAELAGHIIMDGRQQFLDEEAVAFLDERRQKNPVVVYQQSKDEAIETMRVKLEGAYEKIAAQAIMITDLQQFKIDTMEQRAQLEDARTAQERRERELQTREDEMDQALAAARQEASEEARKAAEEKAAQELVQEKQRHQDELTAAQERLQKYKDEVAAYNKLPALRRMFTKAPVLQED